MPDLDPTPTEPPASPRATRPSQSRLFLYLTLAYSGLIIYASLHPFSGWRSRGISPFAWVDERWPRYWTLTDVSFDLFSYAVLGFLITFRQREQGRRVLAILIGITLPSLLSFAMESTQTWLPSRVASNLDWGCNTLGGILGACLAALTGQKLIARINIWRKYLIAPHPRTDWGLTLLALWLFAQLSPETLPFSTGDLRHFFNLSSAASYDTSTYTKLFVIIVACNLVTIGLITRSLVIDRILWGYSAVLAVFVLAFLVRTLAGIILVPGEITFNWMSSSVIQGLLIGSAVLFTTLWMPASARLLLVIISLMGATALVNLTPENPYMLAAQAAWRQGHFLNFNGMTRMVAGCWPFLAVSYLFLLGREEA